NANRRHRGKGGPCARRTHFTLPPTPDGAGHGTGRRGHVGGVRNVSDRPVGRLVLVPKCFFLVPKRRSGTTVEGYEDLDQHLSRPARQNPREIHVRDHHREGGYEIAIRSKSVQGAGALRRPTPWRTRGGQPLRPVRTELP